MAKVPQSHVTGRNAINFIKEIIPDYWIVNEMYVDYGLDLHVEIVKNGETTGKMFFIQSKGTDEDTELMHSSFSLSMERLSDYNNIESPVLMVRPNVNKGIVWGKWLNALYNTLEKDKQRQLTLTINFNESNIINTEFFKKLEDTFSCNIPYYINIVGQTDSDLSERYNSQLKKILKSHYGENVIFNDSIAADILTIHYSTNETGIHIKLVYRTKVLSCNVDVVDNQFLYIPFVNKRNCPAELITPLVNVSILLSDMHQVVAADIVKDNLLIFAKSQIDSLCVIQFVSSMIRSKLYNDIDSIFTGLLNMDMLDMCMQICHGIFISSDPVIKSQKYELYIKQIIVKTEDSDSKSMLSYNIANYYRCKGMLYNAHKYYQLARKYNPEYGKRDYWLYEYAGVLYLSGHYKFAELYYKEARKNSVDEQYMPIICELISDTLFKQYKFNEALEEYHCYLEYVYLNKLELSTSFDLKSTVYNYLCDKDYITDILKDDYCNENFSAIFLNPLDDLSWFNIGVYYKLDNPKLSYKAFLIAWCIKEDDLEAIINCFFLAFNNNKSIECAKILCVINEKFGVDGINSIAQEIQLDTELNQEKKDFIINAIASINQHM